MFTQNHFRSMPTVMLQTGSMILIIMIGICPAMSFSQRNFLAQTDEDGGKDYLQDPYLDQSYRQMDNGIQYHDASTPAIYENPEEGDFMSGTRENRSKRERCYCDLDLFCKRFGCRRKRGHLARQMRSMEPVSNKARLLLELARSMNAAMARRISS